MISSTVSPRNRNAISKPPVCAIGIFEQSINALFASAAVRAVRHKGEMVSKHRSCGSPIGQSIKFLRINAMFGLYSLDELHP